MVIPHTFYLDLPEKAKDRCPQATSFRHISTNGLSVSKSFDFSHSAKNPPIAGPQARRRGGFLLTELAGYFLNTVRPPHSSACVSPLRPGPSGISGCCSFYSESSSFLAADHHPVCQRVQPVLFAQIRRQLHSFPVGQLEIMRPHIAHAKCSVSRGFPIVKSSNFIPPLFSLAFHPRDVAAPSGHPLRLVRYDFRPRRQSAAFTHWTDHFTLAPIPACVVEFWRERW